MFRSDGLFSIDGRMDRRRYGWRAGLSLGWILYYAFYDYVIRGPGGPIHVVSLPMVVAWFGAVWVLFAASVRRVQDIGWASWTVAIPIGLALGISRIEKLFGAREALDVGNVTGSIMLIVFVLIAAFKPGQVGENQWGPDPRIDPPAA